MVTHLILFCKYVSNILIYIITYSLIFYINTHFLYRISSHFYFKLFYFTFDTDLLISNIIFFYFHHNSIFIIKFTYLISSCFFSTQNGTTTSNIRFVCVSPVIILKSCMDICSSILLTMFSTLLLVSVTT